MAEQTLIDDVIVVTMQKNEGSLLQLWIDFYARLVPLRHMYVIDNGSDDELTRETLARNERDGLNVVRDYGTAADFARKGRVVQSVIERAGLSGRFALPCDCDELLYLRTSGGPSIKPAHIAKHFCALADQDGAEVFRIKEQFFNIPHSEAAYRAGCQKILIRDTITKDLDNGYHYYSFKSRTTTFKDIRRSRFGFIHFHNKPFDILLESARRKLETRTDDPASGILKGSAEGRHLLRYFHMTEQEYHSSFVDRSDVISLASLFASQGLVVPFAT